MKKILAIGNSFSQDAVHYLPELAKLSGVDARICTLYIGGCRLSLHHENMLSDRKVYKPLYDTELTGFVSLRELRYSIRGQAQAWYNQPREPHFP